LRAKPVADLIATARSALVSVEDGYSDVGSLRSFIRKDYLPINKFATSTFNGGTNK